MLNYEKMLGLDENWKVKGVKQDDEARKVTVVIEYSHQGKYKCPQCRMAAILHDYQERTVRHLDSCEYRTYLQVQYPLVRCGQCGIQPIIPPFAKAGSWYTTDFEQHLLKECRGSTVRKAAGKFGLNGTRCRG